MNYVLSKEFGEFLKAKIFFKAREKTFSWLVMWSVDTQSYKISAAYLLLWHVSTIYIRPVDNLYQNLFLIIILSFQI